MDNVAKALELKTVHVKKVNGKAKTLAVVI